MGMAEAAVTPVSESLYRSLGAGSFWFVAELCVLALPATAALGRGSHNLAKAPGPQQLERCPWFSARPPSTVSEPRP